MPRIRPVKKDFSDFTRAEAIQALRDLTSEYKAYRAAVKHHDGFLYIVGEDKPVKEKKRKLNKRRSYLDGR